MIEDATAHPRRAPFVIRRLTVVDEIEASQRLRYKVWSGEGVTIHETEQAKIGDPQDGSASHWGAYVGGVLIASSRLSFHDSLEGAPDGHMFKNIPLPLPVGDINRLVVQAGYRRLGISEAMDSLRIAYARSVGCRVVLACPIKSPVRMEGLLKHGFVFTGVDGKADWGDMPTTGAYLLLD